MGIAFDIVSGLLLLILFMWVSGISRENRHRDDRVDSHRQRLSDLERRVDDRERRESDARG